MSDGDDCGALCFLILVAAVLSFIFMTVASPGFLLYGFFSNEWLIEDHTNKTGSGTSGAYRSTTAANTNRTLYGLYQKCHQGVCTENILDDTTFGLEVVAVIFQFLAILALPWFVCCFRDNKILRYWNYFFLPFLLIAAVLSLSASLLFHDKYSEKQDPSLEVGKSQVCAGLGGGFQIVLTCVIGGFYLKNGLCCFQEPKVSEERETYFAKTEYFFLQVFSYESHSGQVDVVQVREAEVVHRY